MFDNNKHIVNSEELNHLLDEAFIELDFTNPKNDIIMQAVSNQVMNADMQALLQPNTKILKYKWLLITLAVSLISLLIYFIFSNQAISTQKQVSKVDNLKENKIGHALLAKPYKKEDVVTETIKPSGLKTKQIIIASIDTNNLNSAYSYNAINSQNNQNHSSAITSGILDTTFDFPVLTEKEIKSNHKQKKKMIERLAKYSKEKYVSIPIGSFVYKGDTISLKGFYMQNAEVTNLEYRTFIYDLIIQNKKEEFLLARPNQSQWINMLGNTVIYSQMKDKYFANSEYDDYPVVNISKVGAEMYCKWLTIETNKYQKQKGRALINDLRIPTDFEWNYAAQSGKQREYPWGNGFVANKNGCYFMNFNIQKENIDSIKRSDCKLYLNAISSAGMALGENTITAKVYSYNPNDFSLYCMSGNVAEMVKVAKPKTPQTYTFGTKGGSWNSDIAHTKLIAEDEYNKYETGSPFVGFRPVMSTYNFRYNLLGAGQREYSDDGEIYLGYPIITNEEKKEIVSQKRKMIEQAANIAKNNYSLIPAGTVNYKGSDYSINEFYMQTTEVSNLEYRTFIMDILLQGDTVLFKKIKPDQEQWNKKFTYSFNDPMVNMYFSHPAYNNYPVVTISQQGAEEYCKWLSKEVNRELEKSKQEVFVDIRIPLETEWAYAAKNKKVKAKYANGLDTLIDAKDKCLVNYAGISKNDCVYDEKSKMYRPNNKKYSFMDDGAFHTAPCKTYFPNTYGLYCMAGNAAEMVYRLNEKDKTNTTAGVIGGSWFSCDYFLQIEADDEYPNEINASPLIGFRPIFSLSKK